MAKKKKTTKRSAAKKTTRKKAPAGAASKKSAKKKAATKKVAKKKSTKKKAARKPTKKKVTKKKSTKKSTSKKTSAKSSKASTKKKPTKKKASAGRAPKQAKKELSLEEALEHDWTPAELKKVKTGLKKKDLQYFLNLLLEKRAEIVGDIQGMELTRSGALSDIAHMPLHMADVGSDNFEQEFMLGLMESERKILKDIEEALIRMRDGLYGVCLDSGRPINRARLEIKPWAKYCIEAARIHEKRGW